MLQSDRIRLDELEKRYAAAAADPDNHDIQPREIDELLTLREKEGIYLRARSDKSKWGEESTSHSESADALRSSARPSRGLETIRRALKQSD